MKPSPRRPKTFSHWCVSALCSASTVTSSGEARPSPQAVAGAQGVLRRRVAGNATVATVATVGVGENNGKKHVENVGKTQKTRGKWWENKRYNKHYNKY